MAFIRIESATYKFVVILRNITRFGFFKQIVARFHLNNQRIEGVYYFGGIGYNRLCLVG